MIEITEISLLHGALVYCCVVLLWEIIQKYLLPRLFARTGPSITNTNDGILAVLQTFWRWFYSVLWVWCASQLFPLPKLREQCINILMILVVFRQIWTWIIKVWWGLVKKHYFAWKSTQDFLLIKLIIKWVFWSILWLIVLSNVWVEITPLVASLWVAWIAVSFALQSILEDLFASISIYLDKPFRIGDFITLGENGGTVKHVWIKTTRIQTVLWEEVVVANRKLTEAVIHNFWTIQSRTLTWTFTIKNSTSSEKTWEIIHDLKDIFEFSDILELQRVHCTWLTQYGIEYMYRYTLSTNDYQTHLQIQSRILQEIIEYLEDNEIQLIERVC